MPFERLQKDVDDWIKTTSGYFHPLEILACISEEHGELATEVNNRFGARKKKNPEDGSEIGEEIMDIMFNLICLANRQGINLNEH